MSKLKHLLILSILILQLGGCQKDDADFLSKPNVDMFVKMIKNGTYDIVNEHGDIDIPNFQQEHIPELLKHTDDLSIIPYRYPTLNTSTAVGLQRVGEVILWTIESIRCNNKYPSPNAGLVKIEGENDYQYADNEDILKVALLYKLWWKEEYPFNKTHDKFLVDPLEEMPYLWN